MSSTYVQTYNWMMPCPTKESWMSYSYTVLSYHWAEEDFCSYQSLKQPRWADSLQPFLPEGWGQDSCRVQSTSPFQQDKKLVRFQHQSYIYTLFYACFYSPTPTLQWGLAMGNSSWWVHLCPPLSSRWRLRMWDKSQPLKLTVLVSLEMWCTTGIKGFPTPNNKKVLVLSSGTCPFICSRNLPWSVHQKS